MRCLEKLNLEGRIGTLLCKVEDCKMKSFELRPNDRIFGGPVYAECVVKNTISEPVEKIDEVVEKEHDARDAWEEAQRRAKAIDWLEEVLSGFIKDNLDDFIHDLAIYLVDEKALRERMKGSQT